MTNNNSPLKGFRPLGGPSKPGSQDPQPPQEALSNPVSQPQGSFSIPTSQPTPAPAVGLPIQRGQLCPSCNRLNSPNSAYCNNCGAALQTAQPVAPQTACCPKCSTTLQPDWKFCLTCGYPLSQPAQPAQSFQPGIQQRLQGLLKSVPSFKNTSFGGNTSISANRQPWPTVAVVAAVCALISFFLPLVVLKISVPTGMIPGDKMNITFSMSALQVLSMSSPTVSGLGSLGEVAENLFDGLDMGAMLYDSANSSMKLAILLGRGMMLLLGSFAAAATYLSIQSYNHTSSNLNKLMMFGGFAAAIILVISTTTVNVGFRSGSGDVDAILNSIVGFSNGPGFWGMLFGFVGFGLSGYMRK